MFNGIHSGTSASNTCVGTAVCARLRLRSAEGEQICSLDTASKLEKEKRDKAVMFCDFENSINQATQRRWYSSAGILSRLSESDRHQVGTKHDRMKIFPGNVINFGVFLRHQAIKSYPMRRVFSFQLLQHETIMLNTLDFFHVLQAAGKNTQQKKTALKKRDVGTCRCLHLANVHATWQQRTCLSFYRRWEVRRFFAV